MTSWVVEPRQAAVEIVSGIRIRGGVSLRWYERRGRGAGLGRDPLGRPHPLGQPLAHKCAS